MKKVLVLCETDLSKDPRVIRQIKALKGTYRVCTWGVNASGIEDEFYHNYPITDFHFKYPYLVKKIISAGILLNLKFSLVMRPFSLFLSNLFSKKLYYEKQYWNRVKRKSARQLQSLNPDLILANDIYSLPLALKVANGRAKVYFDAHEYHPRELEDNKEWVMKHQPFILYLCQTYIAKADFMTTVSPSIAMEYEKNYGIKVEVITNATEYVDLKPKKRLGTSIKLIHHGAAIPERNLERMIEAMEIVGENYTLDLMLVPTDPAYLHKLKNCSVNSKKIKFLDPVPTDMIPHVLNEYDAGIVFIPPTNFNYEFCLPNKYFETIQGRIALVLGPTKDMVNISEKYHNAIVAKDFSVKGLADALLKLNDSNINLLKENSDVAAKELNSAANQELIKHAIAGLIGLN